MLDDKMEGALPSEPMENGVSHRFIHPAVADAGQPERRIEQKRDELTEIIIAASEEWLKLYGRMHLHLEHKAEYIAAAVSNAGYRKQSEGEWITKHRHRGGFRTVTVVDSLGEKHTGTVDDRWECDDLYCSVCGKIAHDAFLNYCANCGAKMKGGE